MSDESPTKRLSQIFESLSCWNDLKNLDAASTPNQSTTISNTSSSNDLFLSTTNSTNSSSSPASTSNPPSASSSLFLSGKRSSTGGSHLFSQFQQQHHQNVINNTIPPNNLRHFGPMTSRSTPNSPRLLPRRVQSTAPATVASKNLHSLQETSSAQNNNGLGPESSPWLNLANLTDYLDVHQLNNYQQNLPEINWQERCLELQLELHRSKSQAGRFQNRLREKLSEVEKKLFETEERADLAEEKVRAMEKRLNELPKQRLVQKTSAANNCGSQSGSGQSSETASVTDTDKTITNLEHQVEEQKLLRIQDARQVEAKAAKIKEWVTNKLKDLETQNQVLREQNQKCNQQLELLRNHISSQSNSRKSSTGQYNFADYSNIEPNRSLRRRSESLDPPGSRSGHRSGKKQHHKRNLSMETHELARDLAEAVDGLNIVPMPHKQHQQQPEFGHDYAEIYTPSQEKMPHWLHNELSNIAAKHEGKARPPTPPLHRFPSWEAKIYQVANNALVGNKTDSQDLTATAGGSGQSSQNNTLSAGYCDINVPVYATVKGRASQIRSIPFTGESSDDSSDAEENAMMVCTATYGSHNSSNTDNTETSMSGSSSSPSRSMKTSPSLSPGKQQQHQQHHHHQQTHHHQSIATPVSTTASPKYQTKIRDISFESGMSDDYAIPPDAVPTVVPEPNAAPCMNMSMQSLLMRSSYVDSPSKKVETLEKMGTLAKLGGKLKTWQKRYFVLKNGVLTYYKTQNDQNRKPQGQIVIDEDCRITKVEGASTFEINTGKKTYYLTADSNATMDEWVRVLQNVQKRNATKLLLTKNDQHKPTISGWATKVKNGHSKKCWCVLFGKMFLYFKNPDDANSLGQINMRDCRVEEVEHVSDSDSEEREDPTQSQARLTVAINPMNAGPTYLIFGTKQDRDNWLYHLTVVSSVGPNAGGSQYEQIVQKLMETDGDPNCVLWRHPVLQYTKELITSPLSSLNSDVLQSEAIKLFKCCQLFMSVQVNQPGIDYHVVLAQNALQQCLDMPELQDEFVCALVKQTSRLTGQKIGVQVNKKLGKQTRVPIIPTVDCKSNPPAYTFVQGWQLLALAVSLFIPKNNRLLWYLKLHLSRNADTKTECGKYAAYCERALCRTLSNGGRETKPSRMEVLSILLKNPYHHSLPHAIPVHMMNTSYQVVSFDGSTTIEEFHCTLAQEIGCRDATNGFTLFSDDPIERDLEHYLDPEAKLCDVISKWETALREKGSGKFENSKVIQLTYKNRLYWKHSTKLETEKERLLLCYQTNQQIVQGRFPLSRELALELASLMAQIDMGDYTAGTDTAKNRNSSTLQSNATTTSSTSTSLQALDRFYPYRYRDALSGVALKELHEILAAKWQLLKGRSVLDCVRIYLTCCRKWPYFGATLFQAKPRNSDQAMVWLAVAEDAISVLELASMMPVNSHTTNLPISRYPYSSVVTFGGCQDDFMLVVATGNQPVVDDGTSGEQKLLFAMSKPKILEITLLIADYMNVLGHTVPGTPQMNTLTRNGSYRSKQCTATGSNACNTLNSFASHTLTSQYSHQAAAQDQAHQPDILKSTLDHHNHTN